MENDQIWLQRTIRQSQSYQAVKESGDQYFQMHCRQTLEAFKTYRLVLEEDQKKTRMNGTEYKDYGLVVQTKSGYPVNPYFLESRWIVLVRESGLLKIRFHDLRHTHASLLLKAGVHPKVVTERLGHSSITITLDRYSHLFPTMQQEAAEKLDELLFEATKHVVLSSLPMNQSEDNSAKSP